MTYSFVQFHTLFLVLGLLTEFPPTLYIPHFSVLYYWIASCSICWVKSYLMCARRRCSCPPTGRWRCRATTWRPQDPVARFNEWRSTKLKVVDFWNQAEETSQKHTFPLGEVKMLHITVLSRFAAVVEYRYSLNVYN